MYRIRCGVAQLGVRIVMRGSGADTYFVLWSVLSWERCLGGAASRLAYTNVVVDPRSSMLLAVGGACREARSVNRDRIALQYCRQNSMAAIKSNTSLLDVSDQTPSSGHGRFRRGFSYVKKNYVEPMQSLLLSVLYLQ